MHMADALVSPAVGGTMMLATTSVAAHAIKKIQLEADEKKIPLMGVMGAFIFAAQMINFTIPGTGSSGHIGGGILLAILLGPQAGFLTMAAILLIQALFFGDGGLLAYGSNVFNLGFFTCFVAYPLIYKPIVKSGLTARKIFGASVLATIIGLQLGAFGVVLETVLSGRTELPFTTFLLVMQPIHLAIGLVEGLITAAIVTFVWRARPELLERTATGSKIGNMSIKKLVIGFLVAAVLVGGGLSWFASANPDGLEWAIERTAGTPDLTTTGRLYDILAYIQSKTALFPDYSFKWTSQSTAVANAGTSFSGILGGALTIGAIALMGFALTMYKKRKQHKTK